MDLSLVTTMYRSASHLRAFYDRMTAAALQITSNYELILVNDGSPDESLDLALELMAQDCHVKVIDLSRNFGHHPAIMTGLRNTSGNFVFLIDCDLEEAPELLNQFHERLKGEDADVVYGVQEKRVGSFQERWSGLLFYKLFNALSSERIPENIMTVRLMTRRFVDALCQHHEVDFIIAGLWARTGFRQIEVPVRKQHKGNSTYNLARKVALSVNAITSFSGQPLVFIFYLGSAIVFLSILAAGWLVVNRLLGGVLSGWTSVMVSIWLLGGLIIFCQGVIGIYLSKIYAEAKRRPVTIIRHVYERHEENNHDASRHAIWRS